MSIEEIAALPVGDMAEPDAHLYLWIPDCHLIAGHGATIARAWGFEPGRLLIWHKSGFGLGRFPRPQHEALIVCKRGSLPFAIADVGSVHRWKSPYENGARKHSAKPDGAVDLIERASPGPIPRTLRPPRPLRLGLLGRREPSNHRAGQSRHPAEQGRGRARLPVLRRKRRVAEGRNERSRRDPLSLPHLLRLRLPAYRGRGEVRFVVLACACQQWDGLGPSPEGDTCTQCGQVIELVEVAPVEGQGVEEAEAA